MNITLVYTGITNSGFNALKGNEGTFINHGLAILSAAAKKEGFNVKLFDLRRMTGWDDFRNKVSNDDSDIYGITMMSVDYLDVKKAAEIIKEVKPNSKTVTGGPHPSICTEEVEKTGCFDYIVTGEGEITFPKLVREIKNKNIPKRIIKGEPPASLDDVPWADRDLFKGLEEPFVPFLEPPFITMIAGRGCIYNCSYCQPAERIMFGRHVRRRSVGSIIEELKFLREEINFKSFMFHDDCLTENPEWVEEFCEHYVAEGFDQHWVAQSRADLICKHPQLMRKMHDAGLKLVSIGFESGSDRVLKFIRKGTTRAQNIRAAEICREIGIRIWANYMLGLPTETKEEVKETYTMLRKIKPYHCSPAFYTPHPGSDLFTYGEKNNLHLMKDHTSYRRNVYEPKIKGPDYKFLKEMLIKTMDLTDGNIASTGDGKRANAGIVRHFKSSVKKNFPSLFHSIRKIKNFVLRKQL